MTQPVGSSTGIVWSFVIPAHNEADYIGDCLQAIQETMEAFDASVPWECIVVDDDSTDQTADLARSRGARVLQVKYRQISAVRNEGGQNARGSRLVFLDADTLLNLDVLQAIARSLDDGAKGGGCVLDYREPLPWWVRCILPFFCLLIRVLKHPGGACLYCTREAFDLSGGFHPDLYVAEDAVFVRALKRVGRFDVPRPRIVTSARNLQAHSLGRFLQLGFRFLRRGPRALRQREGWEIWYRPERSRDTDKH